MRRILLLVLVFLWGILLVKAEKTILQDNGVVPRIDIDIKDSLTVTSKDYYLDAMFTITGYGIYDDFVDTVQIKGRGNSSWKFAKKPYRLKFFENVTPFGLAAGRNWVLLANAQKGSMMANAVAMKVGQLAKVPYTNNIIPVELYINGEYRGSYMFTEKIGLSENSINVDYEFGCMLELDSYYDENFKFNSKYYKLPVNIKDPNLKDYDDTVRIVKLDSIQNQFNRLDSAVYKRRCLSDVLDVDATARFVLVNDLVFNRELESPKSVFLWKENIYSSDSKFVFGPLWDFDYAFGYPYNKEYFTFSKNIFLEAGNSPGYKFFTALKRHPEFRDAYYRIWCEFVEEGCIKEVMAYMSEYYELVKESFEHNALKWGDGASYDEHISTMQQWIKERHDYIASSLFVGTRNYYNIKYVIDSVSYRIALAEPGDTIIPIKNPCKKGYTFGGWGEIPDIMPAEDVIIEGGFTINSYNVTYMLDGEEYKKDTIAYGDTLPACEVEERLGCTFSGWVGKPNVMPAEDIVLNGIFTAKEYSVTYVVDCDTIKIDTVAFGAEIPPIEIPTKEGYVFSGWSDIPRFMPAENVTVWGTYTLNSAIECVIPEKENKDIVYTLYGERILYKEKLKRGIYIVNGKKVFIR